MCFFCADPGAAPPAGGDPRGAPSCTTTRRCSAGATCPIDASALGPVARDSMPRIRQLFIGRTCAAAVVRAHALHDPQARRPHARARSSAATTSTSRRCSSQHRRLQGPHARRAARRVLPRPRRPARPSARLALVHSRFSHQHVPDVGARAPVPPASRTTARSTRCAATSTWMARARGAARERALRRAPSRTSSRSSGPAARDSASLDNVVDFLVAGGRIAAARDDDARARGVRRRPRHAARRSARSTSTTRCLVEPWDGPAALAFTDGELDRRDARSQRPAPGEVRRHRRRPRRAGERVRRARLRSGARRRRRGALQPGKMFLVDTARGRIVSDEEIKHQVATQQPYARVARREQDRPRVAARRRRARYTLAPTSVARARSRRSATPTRTCKMILAPMATGGEEPVGSMGIDIAARGALASGRSSLFRYFKQQFAQVTNPPIDPIREEIVMSLVSCVGGEGNLLEETPRAVPHARAAAPDPHATTTLAKLAREPLADFRARTLPMRFRRASGDAGRRARATRSTSSARDGEPRRSTTARASSSSAIATSTPTHAPIPSLLATAARAPPPHPRRASACACGLVVETGEPREVAAPRAAHRLRRRRGQSVPRARDDRALGATDVAGDEAARDATTSRRSNKGLLKIDVQDGHQRRRRATRARRSSRRSASTRWSSTSTSPARRRASAASACARSPTRRWRGTRARFGRARPTTTSSTSAGTTPTASTASAHLWTPKTRRAAAEGGAPRRRRRATTSTRGSSTTRPSAPMTLRGLWDLAPAGPAGAARRGRAGRGDRQALRHRRDVASGQHLARRRTRTSPSR